MNGIIKYFTLPLTKKQAAKVKSEVAKVGDIEGENALFKVVIEPMWKVPTLRVAVLSNKFGNKLKKQIAAEKKRSPKAILQ